MTCFWDGIISKLGHALNSAGYKMSSAIPSFINALQRVVTEVPKVDVDWNGQPISQKHWEECIEWIVDYNVDKISSGHDCSTCDPFLILLCQMLHCNITHNYHGYSVNYTYSGNVRCNLLITFNSDAGHFW